MVRRPGRGARPRRRLAEGRAGRQPAPVTWPASGLLDERPLGALQGQRQNPYQVCVDLAGPAYKCSCPSRKFPCKHALGLLLLWAEVRCRRRRRAPASSPSGRRAGAARAAGRRAQAAGTPDPVAAAKRARAARRAGRRRHGRAEPLARRPGAAGPGRRRARRAPARSRRWPPGWSTPRRRRAASAVRRLGGDRRHRAAVGRPAARRAGPAAAAGRRPRPARRAAARRWPPPSAPGSASRSRPRTCWPGPRVADRWQVLGQVDSDDGALTTRRSWLRGARQRPVRADPVVRRARASRSPPTWCPGTEFRRRAVLLSRAPRRCARWSRTGTAAPPAVRPRRPARLPLRAALAGWAADAGRRAVAVRRPDAAGRASRPSADGWLADAAGAALPLAPGHREPWWLLAAAGGAAGDGRRPSGRRPGCARWPPGSTGGYVPAGPPVPDPGAPRGPPSCRPTCWRPRWSARPAARGPPAGRPRRRRPVRPPRLGVGSRRRLRPCWRPPRCAHLSAGRASTPAAGSCAGAGRARPRPTGRCRRRPGARLLRILADGGAPGGAQQAQELLAQWLGRGRRPRRARAARVRCPRCSTRAAATARSGPRSAGSPGGAATGWPAMRADWRWLRDEAPGARVPDARTWETGTRRRAPRPPHPLRGTDPAAALRPAGEHLGDGGVRGPRPVRRARSPPGCPPPTTRSSTRRSTTGARRSARPPSSCCAGCPARRSAGGWPSGPRRRAARAPHLRRRPALVDAARRSSTPELRRDGVAATPGAGHRRAAPGCSRRSSPAPRWTTWSADRPEPGRRLDLARGHDWESPLLHGWAKAAIAQADPAGPSALVATTPAEHGRAARGGPLGPAPGAAARRAGPARRRLPAPRGPPGPPAAGRAPRRVARRAARVAVLETDRPPGPHRPAQLAARRAVPGRRAGHAAARTPT